MTSIFRLIKQVFTFVRKVIDKVIEVIVSILNGFLLIIVYIIGIGPIALSAKLSGKHFLPIKKEAATYWKQKEQKKMVKTDYYKQF